MVDDSEACFVEAPAVEDALEYPVGSNDFGTVVLAHQEIVRLASRETLGAKDVGARCAEVVPACRGVRKGLGVERGTYLILPPCRWTSAISSMLVMSPGSLSLAGIRQRALAILKEHEREKESSPV